MHTLYARAIDVNLEERARQREQIDFARRKLHRKRRLRQTARQGLVVICPHALQHERQETAQDAVFIEAFDPIERVIDGLYLTERGERGRPGAGWIEAMLEQFDETARDRCVPRQHLLHVVLAERAAGLAQHLGIKTQDRRLARCQPGREHQPVEPVVFDGAGPGGEQRLLEPAAQIRRDIGRHGPRGEGKFVNPDGSAVGALDAERFLGHDSQPEIFEDRQHLREHNRAAGPVEAQPRRLAAFPGMQRGFERRSRQ